MVAFALILAPVAGGWLVASISLCPQRASACVREILISLPDASCMAAQSSDLNQAFDPYDILSLDPAADDAAVRAAFRSMMRRFHPDVSICHQAHDISAQVTAAYAILGRSERRRAYDRRRTETADWPSDLRERRDSGQGRRWTDRPRSSVYARLASGTGERSATAALILTLIVAGSAMSGLLLRDGWLTTGWDMEQVRMEVSIARTAGGPSAPLLVAAGGRGGDREISP
jgi:hypothetical protein